MADALCWILSARAFLLDVLELEKNGPANPVVSDGLEGTLALYSDLCHAQVARSAGEVGRITAELVFGYNRHPAWENAENTCYRSEDLIALESLIPGIGSVATDVIDAHPPKAGPCVRFDGYEQYQRLRNKLDGCITGCQLAKDRAAESLVHVMIPAALDYPA
jgi:hypothetical protein